MATLSPKQITNKCVAIVKFGPAGLETDGFRPAEYYQVTIDPSYVSNSGEYIRFGHNPGDEIQGWQRVAALTVIEILADWDGDESPNIVVGHDSVEMKFLEKD